MATSSSFSQNSFNFDAFNAITQSTPAGMKVFLAQQLLAKAVFDLEMYENPNEGDLRAVLNSLKEVRASMKSEAAARAKARGE